MTKVASYKCDRCGVLMDGAAELERGMLRLSTNGAIWNADLCPPCSEQIRGTVTFLMKARKKRGRQKGGAQARHD
jgi:hypothetical protein